MINRTLEYSPADLGVNGVDLKAVATTKYSTPGLDLGDYANFLLSLIVTITGAPTLGDCKLTATLYAKDGTTSLLVTDILTAISTTAARNEVLSFGRDFAAKKVGNGTLGTDPDILRTVGRVKFTLVVTTQNNGTTALAYLRVRAQK